MDLMREPGTVTAQGLPGMGDHPTAVSIYAGIVTALLHRERTGEGAFVHTSLLANGLWSVSAIAQGVMAGADMARYRKMTQNPGYTMRVYRTKDDRWLQFNMVRNEELLSLMLTAMDAIEVLADERFETPVKMYQNRNELSALIQEIVEKKNSDEWLEIFGEFDVPVNRLGIVEETKDDAQIHANRMATRPEGFDFPLVVNHPVQVDTVPHAPITKAPDLGEHSLEILLELGYTDSDIDKLIERDFVAESQSD